MPNEKDASAEGFNLLQEYAQGLLELLISNKVLDHVPVVKTIIAAITAVGNVRDAILVKKIEEFIAPLFDLPATQRVDMVQRLESDPGYNRKVGLHLIELLDRIDSHRKPVMVGHAFAAYALRRIDLTTLHRLIAGIERLPSHEIDAVRRVHNATINNRQELGNIDPESIYAMINAGLAHIHSGFGGGGLEVTPTGSALLELDLDRKSAS